MLLELQNGDVILKDNTVENLNGARIYLKFKDVSLKHTDAVKLYFNEKEQFRIANDVFRIDPTSFIGRSINVKVVVYRDNNTTVVYQRLMQIEQYFSLGKQPYEKMPQILIDINKEILKLSDRITDLEKDKNVI